VKWKGASYFIIFGELYISDCEWNLAEHDNDSVHFQLNNGSFKCYNVVVRPFTKSSLKFFNCTSCTTTNVSCVGLVYRNITSDLSNFHFTFGDGPAIFTDSVLFFFFFFFVDFIFRFLKKLKENFFIKLMEK
jgi:hypothetical protein